MVLVSPTLLYYTDIFIIRTIRTNDSFERFERMYERFERTILTTIYRIGI